MSDLISRRKAFEYFVTLWECIGTIMDYDEWEDVCMTTANEIPSAEPEIIRCKNCKYNTSSHKCINPDSFFLIPKDDDFCSYAKRRVNDE